MSLVELLIAVSISAVAIVILASMFVNNNSLFFQQSTKVSQGLSINDALTQISKDIRSAAFIAGSYTQSTPSYTTGEETIVIAIPAIDSNGKNLVNVYDYIVITKDPSSQKILRRHLFPDAASSRSSSKSVLATNLSLIKFSYLDNNNVNVTPQNATKVLYTINFSEKAGLSIEESSRSGEINLRND